MTAKRILLYLFLVMILSLIACSGATPVKEEVAVPAEEKVVAEKVVVEEEEEKKEETITDVTVESAVFEESVQYLGSSDSLGVALADVDGDGDLDAFVININPKPATLC